MSIFPRKHPAAGPVTLRRESGPARAAQQVPASLVSLTKAAAVSLTKAGLVGQRAAVYLALDHSGSMRSHYRLGHVQTLAERTLALSANLDDDGVVPVVYFGTRPEEPVDVRLDNVQGIIHASHSAVGWGSTNYAGAIEKIVAEHQASGAADPALVVFQTDGQPDNRVAAERALSIASSLPMFWLFVGFGRDVDFLRELDTIQGRAVNNTGFFHALDPTAVTDAQLYDAITAQYAAWVVAAARAGIVQ